MLEMYQIKIYKFIVLNQLDRLFFESVKVTLYFRNTPFREDTK
jgi:hypothetical protein